MLVFAIGALSLAASSALLAREVAGNADLYRASSLARTRIELTNASRCEPGAGIDRLAQVSTEWMSTAFGSSVVIDQKITRRNSRGSYVDIVHGGSSCR
jgi:hypothetical protein